MCVFVCGIQETFQWLSFSISLLPMMMMILSSCILFLYFLFGESPFFLLSFSACHWEPEGLTHTHTEQSRAPKWSTLNHFFPSFFLSFSHGTLFSASVHTSIKNLISHDQQESETNSQGFNKVRIHDMEWGSVPMRHTFLSILFPPQKLLFRLFIQAHGLTNIWKESFQRWVESSFERWTGYASEMGTEGGWWGYPQSQYLVSPHNKKLRILRHLKMGLKTPHKIV